MRTSLNLIGKQLSGALKTSKSRNGTDSGKDYILSVNPDAAEAVSPTEVVDKRYAQMLTTGTDNICLRIMVGCLVDEEFPSVSTPPLNLSSNYITQHV